ncbi:SGNH/GDSL hydrolase family protein [Planococcus sp. CAU13]|uniref:SGNH/GDSL hydrolase family protein n=1 Tax=Planococcus sp. CAU13 TaxID=1541197 RepID=UPI0005300454|nr:GDSL-type esterase/lipase family protein [Planococcus sp. CAU13]
MIRKFLSGVLNNKAPLRNIRKRNKEYSVKNIVILGDSVAYGYGTKEGIAKYLRESFPDSRITNLGINGLTSDGLVTRLTSGHWDHHIASADLALINIGGNDLLQGLRKFGPAGLVRNFKAVRLNYRKNLLAIYSKIRELNPEVLLVQNDLYNSMKKEHQYLGLTKLLYRQWNRAIGESGVIISRTDKMGGQPHIWLDGIHPNEEGYRVMHELLIDTLRSTGVVLPQYAEKK